MFSREGNYEVKVALTCAFSIALLVVASGHAEPAANDDAVPAVGLAIGQPAPAFSLKDQFGHEQSNSTLKGSKGTVLLFFRSADW
jgi:cytochrome oxidase Cu insertion factor (SCO1/SenC/PrrC family)